MWTYRQSTGAISLDGQPVGVGYAGIGKGKNNPAMQAVHNIGPLPQGRYGIGPARDEPALGPCTIQLEAAPTNQMFGRFGFFIHADSAAHPGLASHGCIVTDQKTRKAISASGVRVLTVIE